MSVVELEITQPAHDTPFFGNSSITFRGATTDLPQELAGVPLYFRWYSSLFPAEKDRYSINLTAFSNPDDPLVWTPGPGTHVITFAVTDQPGETDADLEAVQHGGVTGGSDGDSQCIVHVFKADMVAPVGSPALDKASSILEAEAPALWGKPTDTEGVYELNSDYHDLNRLQYRWEFVPSGSLAGRNTINFIPAPEQYTFIPPEDPDLEPTVIHYEGALPADLDGQYTLFLHVEDKDGVLGGDRTNGLAVNVS